MTSAHAHALDHHAAIALDAIDSAHTAVKRLANAARRSRMLFPAAFVTIELASLRKAIRRAKRKEIIAGLIAVENVIGRLHRLYHHLDALARELKPPEVPRLRSRMR